MTRRGEREEARQSGEAIRQWSLDSRIVSTTTMESPDSSQRESESLQLIFVVTQTETELTLEIIRKPKPGSSLQFASLTLFRSLLLFQIHRAGSLNRWFSIW